MDVSPSGFRVAHGYRGFSVGDRVLFRHSSSAGAARVVWNRIAGTAAETGFLVQATQP